MRTWNEEERRRVDQARLGFLAVGYTARLADMGTKWALAEARKKGSLEENPKDYLWRLDYHLHHGAQNLVKNFCKKMAQ